MDFLGRIVGTGGGCRMVEMAAAWKLFWDGRWAIQQTARKLLSTLVCQLLASTQYMLFLEQV